MLAVAVVLAVVLIVLLALGGLRLLQLAYRAFDRGTDEREGTGKGERDTALPGHAGHRV